MGEKTPKLTSVQTHMNTLCAPSSKLENKFKVFLGKLQKKTAQCYAVLKASPKPLATSWLRNRLLPALPLHPGYHQAMSIKALEELPTKAKYTYHPPTEMR